VSDWAWVALGYATTGTAVAGYVVVLLRRQASLRRRTGTTR
jgi:CcmD family protein